MATDEAPAGLPDKCEIAVVGGGIAGLSTALFLAQAGRDVVLLDKGSPWGDSSGANAGTLSLQVKRTEMFEMGSTSIDLWAAFGAEMGIDVGFHQPGGLRVAETDEQVAFLREYGAEQEAVGFEFEWLEGNELRALAPWLGPDVRAATFCAADGYASPLIAGPSLVAGARAAGVRVIAGAEVTEARTGKDGHRLSIGRRTLACEHLAIAAG
ncbi:MAG: FAD-binding oxidoreductase, partial [Rhodospirillaceae bacterium]|nr:FAD-binding oxidoreductase [Rhodospirillaceae bacterium]